MGQSIYSKIISQLKDDSDMNQADIANLLGVSQATVSRIEKNLANPRGKLAEKIRNLPLKTKLFEKQQAYDKIEKKIDLVKEIKTLPIKPFDISYMSVSYSSASGDLCITKKLNSERAILFLADCVGHGPEANQMAFAVRFGIETILNTLNTSSLSPSIINEVLNGAYGATHEAWAGPPAFVTALLDVKKNQVRLKNNLLPPPLLFLNNEVRGVGISAEDSLPQITKQDEVLITMKPGSSLLFCSDGLLDLFEGTQPIRDRLFKAAKAFKGDSKAILLNVMNGARAVSKENILEAANGLSDDTSVMIITRGKD